MQNSISLDRPGRNYNTDKTPPETYKQANFHQPTDHKPMGLKDINDEFVSQKVGWHFAKGLFWNNCFCLS